MILSPKTFFSGEEEGMVGVQDQGWSIPPAAKKTRKKSKKNMLATRFSTRAPSDGIPIQEKAMLRMRIKNLEDKGKTSSSNPFTILNNASDDHISSVINQLDIVVDDMKILYLLLKQRNVLEGLLLKLTTELIFNP